jgi:hypothetical protein
MNYTSFEELSDTVRIKYGVLGYRLKKIRSKKDSQGVVKKVWLSCEYHGSRKKETGCNFIIVCSRISSSNWKITSINGSHNHPPRIEGRCLTNLKEQEMEITKSLLGEIPVDKTASANCEFETLSSGGQSVDSELSQTKKEILHMLQSKLDKVSLMKVITFKEKLENLLHEE